MIKCFVIEPLPDEEQISGESKNYKRIDTGEILVLDLDNNTPVGAMWRATWLEDFPIYCGDDGQSWMVMTPGGEWFIDGKASNCTKKEDATHKCWCRHGIAPDFTVDKNCNSCSAGAGSIQIGDYHGFLQNGYLT